MTDSWDQFFHSKFPTFEGGINLTLPDPQPRSAGGKCDGAVERTGAGCVRTADCRTASSSACATPRSRSTQGRGQVAAAEKARSLAQQTLDDEEKKYQLGSSTSYNVVLRSRDLTTAEGTELRARINLIEAAVAFNQAVGRTLEVNNITVADALKGAVSGVPNIPGTPDPDAQAGHK